MLLIRINTYSIPNIDYIYRNCMKIDKSYNMKIQLKTKTSVVPRWILYINDFSVIFLFFTQISFIKPISFNFRDFVKKSKKNKD